MKSTAFVLIWTIIFIIIGIFVNFNVDNFTEKYTDNITVIENYIEDDNWEEANNKLNEFCDTWYKEKNIYYKLLDHTFFDDISLYTNILDKSIELKDKSKCLEQIETIKITLENIIESVKFDINHIL
ncbi:DUF4363 family protein [Romboutsia weinsteinii]|uniref:DUF4363 family protein n=1 Tax=Romboutsia weinsteinii TaxID=2020949 RepID=A0A371J6R2_9FIRM|nr:DUF4363 family protein [Romboutsia weinsteinii]RDY28373.1 DUF4363 family protein [Romboutsia weinsteinii]